MHRELATRSIVASAAEGPGKRLLAVCWDGLTGDWDTACRALAADPLCRHLSLARVRKMGRALLEANREYLPQFFGRKRVKR